jgi:polysaccharide pyruvyl transferase WcaK-like protein
MLIAPGTGLLTHFDWGVFGRPYDIFKWSIIAKLCRCKLLFVSVGAGPIRHPVGRWFIKSALWMADYRSYRNIKSRRYLEGIGFKTDGDPIYPDLAFSLPVDMMPDGRHHDNPRRTVGVGVMDYYGQNNKREEGETIYRDYIQETSNFVAWLLDNQYTVRLLMGDTLCDSCAKEDLKEALKKRGYDDENGRILDEPISSVEQLLSQLAETDIVVSPRFHNILLALMLGKPVVALSYHDKIDSLIGEMELTAYGQHLDQLDSNRVIEQVLELEKNAKDLMPSIQIKAEKYRRSLDEQYPFIFKT